MPIKQISFDGLTTSSIGFGCVSLTAHDSTKAAIEVLETALDLGVTHFDVARAYGSGECEYRLGRFLAGRRDKVTVATKFGLTASTTALGNRQLRNAARMLTKRVPWLKRAAQYVAAHPATGSQGEGAGRFSAKSAEESLNQSLRQLGTDYVDLLLLHECTLADANNEELLAALAGMVRAGKVRQFGLATAAANLPTDLSAIAPAHTVLQFESAALVGDQLRTMTASRRLAITHGVFRNFGALAEKVLQPAFVNAIGASEADEGLAATLNCGKTGLARLMLMDAILANENGIVLFGSTSKDNIANNLAIGSSADDWRGQLRVFRQALERLKP